ncbi:MAG: hypothetical protein ACO1OG_07375 [Devosia sp.]
MSARKPRPIWVRVLRSIGRAVVLVVVVVSAILDEIVSPVLRPVIGWLTRLKLFQWIGEALGRLPPYVALVTPGVPFLIIEPAKVVALWWMAAGHVITGTIGLLVAEALSVLVCDRIFHAAYAPLMRIGWFAASLNWLIGLRDAAVAWVKATSAWQSGVRLVQRVRAWWQLSRR